MAALKSIYKFKNYNHNLVFYLLSTSYKCFVNN